MNDDEIAELRRDISAMSEQLSEIDRALHPCWQQEREIKAMLKVPLLGKAIEVDSVLWAGGTWDGKDRCEGGTITVRRRVFVRNQEALDMRAQGFAMLDDLMDEFRDLKCKRRRLRMDIDAAVRAMDVLLEARDQPSRPQPKRDQLRLKL